MPTSRPAVLLNPLSGRVRREPDAVRGLARRIGRHRYVEAADPMGMANAVAAFDLGQDEIISVVAGDGTLHAVLTALERLRPSGPWPVVAAAPGGTTNMTARDLGSAGRLVPWLEALLAWAEDGEAGRARERVGGPRDEKKPDAVGNAVSDRPDPPGRLLTRPVLRIAIPGADPLVGLFCGAGTVSAGVDFFNRRLRPLGIPEAVGSPMAIVRTLAAMAVGGGWLDRMSPDMSVEVEDGPPLGCPTAFLAASTLHRVIIGARPFWGRGDGPIHLTYVERTAEAIFRSVPRLALGRPGDRLTPERGWHSHDTARVRIAFDGPYIVDGELYRARTADGPLEITAEREVRWWVP